MCSELESFLNNYIEKVKNNTLTNNERLLLTDFFIKIKILNTDKDPETSNPLKYLTLGYYMYNFLLENNEQ